MRSFHDYVHGISEHLRLAGDVSLADARFPEHPSKAPDAPVAVMFSPHPDDECIVGGLALRLLRETDYRVVNVPVTFGSDPERKGPRKKELEDACRYLGFENRVLSNEGLSGITPDERESDPGNWSDAVELVAGTLQELRPQIVFYPHRNDRHPHHCGTTLLVEDALKLMPGDFSCVTVETEFWQAMEEPNVMVELDENLVGDLITALSFHVGEVSRNPYHLTLPAWMMDNVRRGSEILTHPGAPAASFDFGCLYRSSRFRGGEFAPLFQKGRFLGKDDDLADIFEEGG